MKEFKSIKCDLWFPVSDFIWIENSFRFQPISIRWVIDEETIYNDRLQAICAYMIAELEYGYE